jgi:hypothetical protein
MTRKNLAVPMFSAIALLAAGCEAPPEDALELAVEEAEGGAQPEAPSEAGVEAGGEAGEQDPGEQAWQLMLEAGALNDDAVDWKALWRDVRAEEGPPTEEQVATWRADEAAVEKVEAALALGELRIPVPRTLSEEIPDWVVYQFIARAICLRGWEKAAAGDLSGGAGDMLAAVELGERFMGGETYLLPAMVGVAVEGIAISQLDRLMETLAADDRGAHLKAAQAFVGYSEPAAAAARAWGSECQIMENTLRALGEDPESVLALEELPFELPGDAAQLEEGYDVEETLGWHRAFCMASAEAMRQPYIEREPLAPEAVWPAGEEAGNPIGRQIMQQLYDSDPVSYYEREERLSALLGVRALAWAARAYALDRGGELPADAGALVPGYLARLPYDPFGDGPLRLEGDTVVSAGHGLVGVVSTARAE